MRQLPRTRREVTDEILVKVIQPLNIERKGILLNFLGCKDSDKSDVKSVVVEGKFILEVPRGIGSAYCINET